MPARTPAARPDPQAADRAVVAGTAPSSALVATSQAVKLLEHDLGGLTDDLAARLAGRYDPAYFTKVALSQFRRNPETLRDVAATQIGRASFVAAVTQAADVGLPFVMGRAYLVPFKDHGTPAVQLIVGYQGLVDLVTGPGTGVTYVEAAMVYAKDDFSYQRGTGGFLHHREYRQPPAARQEDQVVDRGVRTDVWAMVTFGNGQSRFDVMSYAEVEVIRRRAPSARASSSPWLSDYDEMAKKTVLRRLCKTLKISLPAMQVLDDEDDFEYRRGLAAKPVDTQQAQLRTRLQATLGDQQQAAADSPTATETPADAGSSAVTPAVPDQAPQPAQPTAAQPAAAPAAPVDLVGTTSPADAQPVGKSTTQPAACGATVAAGDATLTCTLSPSHRGAHSDGHHDWPRS